MPEADRKPAPGDAVVLWELPRGLVGGLRVEDQRAITEIIGKPVRLNEYDSEGRAELQFTDAAGVIHFVYVSPDAIQAA